MSISEKNLIDLVAIDDQEAVMVITDHLEWGGEFTDEEHMYLIQEKCNSYIRFYESGQIYEDFPNAVDKKICIEIVAKHNPNNHGIWFLKKLRPFLDSVGISLRLEVKN